MGRLRIRFVAVAITVETSHGTRRESQRLAENDEEETVEEFIDRVRERLTELTEEE